MKILIFLTLIFSITNRSISDDFYSEKKALKMVKNALKEKNINIVEIVDVKYSSGKQEPVKIYRISKVEADDFYAVFTQAKGRYDFFDYLIIANLEFTIEKVKVLKYRSEHGGEIASKKWLMQFENYSSGNLRYKKEISALSGATISANSIVADIPKVLKILKSSCN